MDRNSKLVQDAVDGKFSMSEEIWVFGYNIIRKIHKAYKEPKKPVIRDVLKPNLMITENLSV
jgi:hypothetical protein